MTVVQLDMLTHAFELKLELVFQQRGHEDLFFFTVLVESGLFVSEQVMDDVDEMRVLADGCQLG